MKKQKQTRPGTRKGLVDIKKFATVATRDLLVDKFRPCWLTLKNARVFFFLILLACARRTSLNHACSQVQRRPPVRTISSWLGKFDMAFVEERMNSLLHEIVKKFLWGKTLEIAIDYTLIPYHGSPKKDKSEVVRSRAKHGTCTFHAYATVYAMLFGKRFTIGLVYVRKGTDHRVVIEQLLKRVKHLDIEVKRLYLDREYCVVRVIRYLKNRRIPTIMPVPKRGKTGGIRPYLKGRKSYKTVYTMKSPKDGKVTFPLYIIKKHRKGKFQRKGGPYYPYCVLVTPVNLSQLFDKYRHRFGIESSYRQMNESRARTSSRNPTIRLIYVFVSLLIRNQWIAIRWKHLSHPRQGGRKPMDDISIYKTFLDWIRDYVKARLKEVRVFVKPNSDFPAVIG